MNTIILKKNMINDKVKTMSDFDEMLNKDAPWSLIIDTASSLIEGESDIIANYANISALLWLTLADINWVGFYRNIDNELVLGPFQGKPACIRIPSNKGVCGTALYTKEIQNVGNVHEFPGHIACDGASNSEIVLPIIKNGNVIGVLDIDSPKFNRFNKEDSELLSKIVDLISHQIK